MANTVAAVFGGIYLLVGVVGFATTPLGGDLLGIFAVNTFHHLFHLVVGGLGVVAGWHGRGRLYCRLGAIVFLLLGLLGFAAPGLAAFVLARPHADLFTDNLLHLMTGLGLGYFAVLPRASRRQGPAVSERTK
jgi:hypothetical protein